MIEALDSPDPSVAEHVRRYLATNGESGCREGGVSFWWPPVRRSRTAEGAERERLWRLMVGLAPVYRTYEAHSRRVIPVVVLERVAAEPAACCPGHAVDNCE